MFGIRGPARASLCAAAIIFSSPALAVGPGLRAAPQQVAPANAEKRSGVLVLDGGAYAYLPKGNDGTPLPILVYFVGAGGDPRDVLARYRDFADREKFVLVIPVPKDADWDLIQDLKSHQGARSLPCRSFREGRG
jgi:poly(3-hydroxybutyrate) depolymerase